MHKYILLLASVKSKKLKVNATKILQLMLLTELKLLNGACCITLIK